MPRKLRGHPTQEVVPDEQAVLSKEGLPIGSPSVRAGWSWVSGSPQTGWPLLTGTKPCLAAWSGHRTAWGSAVPKAAKVRLAGTTSPPAV